MGCLKKLVEKYKEKKAIKKEEKSKHEEYIKNLRAEILEENKHILKDKMKEKILDEELDKIQGKGKGSKILEKIGKDLKGAWDKIDTDKMAKNLGVGQGRDTGTNFEDKVKMLVGDSKTKETSKKKTKKEKPKEEKIDYEERIRRML